jgi:hypothetical protein
MRPNLAYYPPKLAIDAPINPLHWRPQHTTIAWLIAFGLIGLRALLSALISAGYLAVGQAAMSDRAGDAASADAACRQALGRSSNGPGIYRALAKPSLKLSQIQAAIGALKQALRIRRASRVFVP